MVLFFIFNVIMGMKCIFIFYIIMEMKSSTVPDDKLIFAVNQSILEMKKIIKKKIITVHQKWG